MNQIEVCFSPNNFPLFYNEKAIVVVIDILRATSAICTAFHYGIDRIIPVSTVEEAKVYLDKGFLAAAERNGDIVDGFSLGNSPFTYMNETIKGKTLALTTTNGTLAIEVAKKSYKVVIGSFLNYDVLIDWLIKENKDVVLLCAGWKNKFNIEDSMFAGAVVKKLNSTGMYNSTCDSAVASQYLYERAESSLYDFLECSSHRRRLEKLKLEKDIRYCLTPNLAPVIPILKDEYLIKLV